MPERFVDLGLILKAEYLAPGQMGCLRNSMVTRETLIRPPLGRHYTRGRSLPPECFVYGKRSERDPDGMAKCLNWCTYRSTEDSYVYAVDYHKTNVESVKAGIHKAPEWVRFRKEKNFHRKPINSIVRQKKPVFPSDMTFGKPTRPSTPIGCLLSHYYKREFDQIAIEYVILQYSNFVKITDSLKDCSYIIKSNTATYFWSLVQCRREVHFFPLTTDCRLTVLPVELGRATVNGTLVQTLLISHQNNKLHMNRSANLKLAEDHSYICVSFRLVISSLLVLLIETTEHT